MDRLDAAAADYVGLSIVRLLYGTDGGSDGPFDQTLYTSPALFMVQYAMGQTLVAEGFPPPDYLLGASLGEFVAAALAGVLEPEAMLFDVIRQAQLFDHHCAGGAMLAVIDDVASFRASDALWEGCELAGIHFDRCFVIAGPRIRIQQVMQSLDRRDVSHHLLPVSVAFHSSAIDPLENIFARMFADRDYHPPRIPLVSCTTTVSASECGLRDALHLWRVVREPIAFRDALARFRQREPDAIYLDAGPSGNMASFVRYNLPPCLQQNAIPVMTQFGRDREALEVARERLRSLGQLGTSERCA